ncbi:MAG: conjugal transfer protein TraF [Elusimicrobiales bacterium]|nr:conjugal transfer protein TraF [Elusimicrobiales bacterium]
MKLRNIVFTFTILAFGASSVFAEQWQVLGTRPMGMGGAFVGMAKGPIAQYWNPAGLYQEDNVSGLELGVGVGIEFAGDIMENASQIGDLADDFSSIQSAQTGGTAVDANEMASFVKTLSLLSDMNEPGNGALFELAGGINLKLSKIAISVNNFTSAGITPMIDTTNIALDSGTGVSGVALNAATDQSSMTTQTQKDAADAIALAIITIGTADLNTLLGTSFTAQEIADKIVQQAVDDNISDAAITETAATFTEYATDAKAIIGAISAGNDYTNNTSNLTVEGASFTEIAFGMAKPMWIDGLLVGGNFKMVNGQVGYSKFEFMAEESGTDNAFDDFSDTMEKSWKPSLDLGFLMQLNKKWSGLPWNPRVGLVIRNLTSPKFDKPATAVADGKGDTYTLDRQVRMGFALSPTNFWHLAMDMDLTKNNTPIDGFKSRQLSLGTEINIFNRPKINIPLRAGIMKNMAESDASTAYTMGLGINLVHLHIDLGGIISADTSKIEDDDVPNKVAFSGSIALLF